ncbi:60S ribosomal protein L28, partial [Caligus rogercresseyi]
SSAYSAAIFNDVVWSVIRGNSAFFLKKRNCPKPFSTEPLNLSNKHSKRYSGLANSKTIGINPTANNKGS